MSKLLWVLLPLLLAGAVLAGLALRRRTPSRLALNVWSSLLLLAYVLGTAGLGLFWVANQQLPVFDWHYLFGYATVLLLMLHLALNFRVVWQHLRQRRPAPARDGVARASGGRRPALAALGLLGGVAVAGVAFVLGLRHGRTELRVEPAAGADAGAGGTGDSAATALALVEQFHEFSAHSRAGLLRRAPAVDWGDPPPPFKHYPGQPRLALPPPQAVRDRPAGRAFDAAALAAVLWHTAGVSRRSGGIAFRTSPSSGALFSTELYVAVRSVDGVAPGLWHYDARAHALERLRDTALADSALGLDAAGADDTLAVVVATAIFRRSGHKYRDRTYRYVLADLGHALENLRVAAQAVGATATLQPQFDEARAAATLAVDEAEEGVLALSVLRPAGMVAPGAPGPVTQVPPAAASRWPPPPLSTAGSAPLGVTDAVHRATSLRAASPMAAAAPAHATSRPASALAAEGSGLRGRQAPRGRALPSDSVPVAADARALPPFVATPVDGLAVIARRRSVRRYAATPLPLQQLSAVLAAMGRQPPLLSDAVRIDVLTQAVEGLAPASWRYAPADHALHLRARHHSDLRRRSRAAALDQDVIGDAAVVFVLSIARAAFAADPAGAARGYRHAFIEAGLVGERLYLAAGARGLGVCAVGAFYDDEAAALAGIDARHEWIVHFAALGVPA